MSEENAKKLMKVLVDNGVQANSIVPPCQGPYWAVQAGMTVNEINEAFEFAGSKDWIENGPHNLPGSIFFTDEGYETGKAQP